MERRRRVWPWILGPLVLVLLLVIILAVANSNPRPAPKGNWGDGVHISAVDPNGDCDEDDLVAGDEDCSDKHYVEAFGHAGVTSKADYGRKYGFYESPEYKQAKKSKKPKTGKPSPAVKTSPTKRW